MKSSFQILKELKASYDFGLVSALVGAGFSKNVHWAYPSWPELLEDIVKELYPADYKKAVRERQRAKKEDENKSMAALVNRIGPLNIVSKYIEYRGVGHEAIDVYIESKIPALVLIDDKLTVNGEEVKREALSAHEALLNCDRIRNIYTTNYENILEATRSYLDIPHFKTIIRSSLELSNSLSKQSIIKVHGDLRSGRTEGNTVPYEFDGDKNLLYIISREDYETYQQKHEAFSFMMRLAMLQGKFCLIGFSGNDPNFKFWLSWMKDILDKEESDEIKVFLIDFFKEELAEDVKLFYANHHIGVINLLDSEVQNVLFPDDLQSIESDTTDINNDREWKDLITELFRYLKGEPQIGPRKEQGKYYSLWADAEKTISNKQDVSSVLRQLVKVRDSLGPQKSVEHQDLILYKLCRKNQLTEAEIDLFAIAAADTGLYPTAFAKILEGKSMDFSKSKVWVELQDREDTLRGEKDIIVDNDDRAKFENALRLLFRFKFSELKKLLENWNPTGDYKYKIAVMLSYFDKEKAIRLVDSYLDELLVLPEQKRMWVFQVANLVYGDFPGHYPLDSFFDQGLPSFNEIITQIGRNVEARKQRILPYSVEDKSVCLNPGNKPFRESSRLLSYLMNWGYTTYYKYITCIPGEIWFQAFVEMFDFYPYAALYYSSLYTDEKLLKRIGQEYAYSRHLHQYHILEEILHLSFCGLADENMPWQNRKGLMIISSEVYIGVKEDKWYEDFKKVILIPYLASIDEYTERKGEVYTNITKAFASLRQERHVEECFIELLQIIEKNPRLITTLINDDFPVERLKKRSYEKELDAIILKLSLAEIYPILYIMNHYGLVSRKSLQTIDVKASKEGLSFIENDRIAILQLSYLVSSEANRKTLKQYVLEKDVWNCGVANGGFSTPSPIKIDKLSDKIVWDESEQAILFANLEKNLKLISERNRHSVLDSLFYSKIVDLLFSMLSFYSKYYKPGENDDLENRIKTAFEKECEISHNLKGLVSDDEDHVLVAIMVVNTILLNNSITETLHEVYAIVNRAMQKNKVALSLVLSEIRLLVEKYERDMWGIYHDVLLQILRDYKDCDYRELNLNLSYAYEYLNKIALSAKRQDIKDEIVDYWLTSKEVLRFNNVEGNDTSA